MEIVDAPAVIFLVATFVSLAAVQETRQVTTLKENFCLRD